MKEKKFCCAGAFRAKTIQSLGEISSLLNIVTLSNHIHDQSTHLGVSPFSLHSSHLPKWKDQCDIGLCNDIKLRHAVCKSRHDAEKLESGQNVFAVYVSVLINSLPRFFRKECWILHPHNHSISEHAFLRIGPIKFTCLSGGNRCNTFCFLSKVRQSGHKHEHRPHADK